MLFYYFLFLKWYTNLSSLRLFLRLNVFILRKTISSTKTIATYFIMFTKRAESLKLVEISFKTEFLIDEFVLA